MDFGRVSPKQRSPNRAGRNKILNDPAAGTKLPARCSANGSFHVVRLRVWRKPGQKNTAHIAGKRGNPESKRVLLAMARHAPDLAEQAEKNCQATLVYEDTDPTLRHG